MSCIIQGANARAPVGGFRRFLSFYATNGPPSPRLRRATFAIQAGLPTEAPQARRLERVNGIEPSSSAWKAVALPLSYTRGTRRTFTSDTDRRREEWWER